MNQIVIYSVLVLYIPIGLGLEKNGRPHCIHVVLQKGSYWCSRNRIKIRKTALSVTTNKLVIEEYKERTVAKK